MMDADVPEASLDIQHGILISRKVRSIGDSTGIHFVSARCPAGTRPSVRRLLATLRRSSARLSCSICDSDGNLSTGAISWAPSVLSALSLPIFDIHVEI